MRNLGIVHQGVDEERVYSILTTQWGSAPESVSVVAKDLSDGSTDVSSAVLSGSPSVLGDVITLPTLKSLVRKHQYRVEVLFTCGENVFETFLIVEAET